jgi:hypothetical protein
MWKIDKGATTAFNATRKRHSFVGGFKFVGTDEYIQIIFIGFGTDECKFIFVGLGHLV